VGSADWILASLILKGEATYLLDSDGRENTLEHGTHQSELG